MSTYEELDLTGFNDDELTGEAPYRPGWYHVVVTEVDNSREKVDALRVGFQILAGTTPNQEGRAFSSLFNDPKPTHKDGGRFAMQIKTAFALAVGVIDKSAAGKRAPVDWDQAIGRQLVVEAEVNGDYLRIKETHSYPVTDPGVAHVPKNAEALRTMGIDPATMCIGNDGLTSNGNGNPAPAAGQAASAQAPAGDAYGDLGI